MQRGLFITLEGGEGAGKSTQARLLAEALRAAGREVVLTREPGGTSGAEAVRGLLLDPETELTPLADTLLHFAARADHVERLIRPALARGAVVICDRFYDSTMAYQGSGMGVPEAAIDLLIDLIGLRPDISFFLELSEDKANERLLARGRAVDRYDAMGAAFAARVAAGFRAIAEREPVRCVVIDASEGIAEVADDIMALLRQRFDGS